MSNEGHQQSPATVSGKTSSVRLGFIQRVCIVFGIGTVFLLLMALLWFAAGVLVLIFSSVLVAVLLHDVCRAVEKWLPLPRGVTLGAVLLVVIALFALVGWLLTPQVIDQVNQLVTELPNALQRLRDFLESNRVLRQVARNLPVPERLFGDPSSILTHASNVFSGVLGGLGSFAIVFFLSVYFAAQPQVYTNGLVKLLPRQRRERGKAVLHELGETLTLWLRGKLLSMALIGVATAIGLGLLGVPLALALGMVAGLLDFIPYLGPILAAVPALLIAFSEGPVLALYVGLLFFALQSLEGYLLLPLVERKTVALPPALTITMQIIMGLAFGLAGVALATPLTAVITVLIAMLYVQDVLEDQIKLPAKQE